MIENTLTYTTRVDKKLIVIDADFTIFLLVYNRLQVVVRDALTAHVPEGVGAVTVLGTLSQVSAIN